MSQMSVSSGDAATGKRLASMDDPDWWRRAAIYQIYPRSFADGNGDGIGDFAGVLSRIDYIAALDVDAVWFNPFYPSALVDGGYDIDDYRAVDPTIGTLTEFDAIAAALHIRGIKAIIDVVPNHSSDRHRWFRDALAASAGSPERDRYIFRDGLGVSGELPPSDWQSILGGPAWTRVSEPDGTGGQWYLHLFAAGQPDWNWANPDVREELLTTLRFWGDRGVDGFRVDTASLLAKDMSEPLPTWADVVAGNKLLGGGESPFPDGQHPFEDRDELAEIYAGWRAVFNTYDPPLFAVAEAWVKPHRRRRYASRDSLGQVFDLDLLVAPWDAAEYRNIIERSLDLARAADTTTTWVLSNHDIVRPVTRLAVSDGPFQIMTVPHPADIDDAKLAVGATRAAAATLLTLALPGSAYLYQGEELGLPEVLGIAEEQAQDPTGLYADGVAVRGRDGSRVPLPWTQTGTSLGFGAGGTWLPQPTWFPRYAAEAQDRDPHSTLVLYRDALRLRRDLRTSKDLPAREDRKDLEFIDLGPGVVAFRRRNGWTSVTNFDAAPIALPAGQVLLRSDEGSGPLPASATAWLLNP